MAIPASIEKILNLDKYYGKVHEKFIFIRIISGIYNPTK